jgi:lipopolysaccharide biosynthesis glycosyltransferase
MYSALVNLSSSHDVEVFVLDSGLTAASRDRLRKVGHRANETGITWVPVAPDELAEHRGRQHLTPTAYARLLIPALLPARVRRAVYLDGDVLVTDDLAPLFHLPLDDAPFGAVRDFVVPTTDSPKSSVRGLVGPKPYCNTGVLVIDPARWLADDFGERALAFARSTTDPLPFADQDAMNAVADHWHELDFRWNVQVLSMHWPELPRTILTDRLDRERDELYRDAAVLHFGGVPKPWQPWSYATSRGKTPWAVSLVRSGWYSPAESARWLVPWLSRRAADLVRRRGRAGSP